MAGHFFCFLNLFQISLLRLLPSVRGPFAAAGAAAAAGTAAAAAVEAAQVLVFEAPTGGGQRRLSSHAEEVPHGKVRSQQQSTFKMIFEK